MSQSTFFHMKLSYKLFYLFLLLPVFSFAQSNYKPGYAVTLKGDTLRGLIDYREWDKTPTTIKFKSSLTDDVKKLSTRDISSFSIANKAEYIRYAGPISMDSTNPEFMLNERDTTFKIDTVFLELLERGKNIALYSYADDIKTRFYVGEAPDYTPKELVFRLYYNADKPGGTGRTINENTYMKQLFALAVKYNMMTDGLQRDIEETGYREAYLIEVANKINNIDRRKSKKH
jgi:hypothetical protein